MPSRLSSEQDLPVTVIGVTFNSSFVVEGMLQSIPAGVSVVLVDNGSGDVAALRDLAADAGADLIELPENIGFGPACNRGVERAQTEFLLFLNPDAALMPDTLEILVAAMRANPQAVAMNPAICDANGHISFKRGSVLLPRMRWLPKGAPASSCVVPVLSGAALLVRRKDFETVKGFDPEIFLYHEDDDLALRLARHGDLMFVREATVSHEGGQSNARTPKNAALKAWHMGRSRVYAARKHGLPHAFASALMQSILQIISPLAWFSARKRAKQTGFLRGVWSMRNHYPDPGK